MMVAASQSSAAAPAPVAPISKTLQALTNNRGQECDSFSPPSQPVVHVPNGKPKLIKLTVPSNVLKEVLDGKPRAKIDPQYEAARQEIARASSEIEPPEPLSPASEDIIPEPPAPMTPRWELPKETAAHDTAEEEPEMPEPLEEPIQVPTLAEDPCETASTAPVIDTGTRLEAARETAAAFDDVAEDLGSAEETDAADEPDEPNELADDPDDSPSQCLPIGSESAILVATPPPSVPILAKLQEKAVKTQDEPKKDEAKKKIRRPILEGSFGPYDIEGEIARGGVGAVFRARERESGRIVALKVLLDGDEAGETERERFRHECETARALSLPGMVQVFEVGELDSRPYMAMELVNGRSLDKAIPERNLTVHDCLVLMKSVADTVGALHEAGYVHPGSEARQHTYRRLWLTESRRLRPCQIPRRDHPSDGLRSRLRHSRVHGPRTGPGRWQSRRSPLRRLGPRRGLV